MLVLLQAGEAGSFILKTNFFSQMIPKVCSLQENSLTTLSLSPSLPPPLPSLSPPLISVAVRNLSQQGPSPGTQMYRPSPNCEHHSSGGSASNPSLCGLPCERHAPRDSAGLHFGNRKNTSNPWTDIQACPLLMCRLFLWTSKPGLRLRRKITSSFSKPMPPTWSKHY